MGLFGAKKPTEIFKSFLDKVKSKDKKAFGSVNTLAQSISENKQKGLDNGLSEEEINKTEQFFIDAQGLVKSQKWEELEKQSELLYEELLAVLKKLE